MVLIKTHKMSGRVWVGLAIVLLLGMGAFGALAYYFLSGLSAGTLKVESEPSGASVMVNGQLVGPTPVVVKGLSGGAYSVRLEKAGCTPIDLRVNVSSQNAALVHEKLKALPQGTLIVNIKPADAEVLLDGELVGHTPLHLANVEAGPHEMLVRKTNFSSYSQRIEIVPGKPKTFEGAAVDLADKVLELLESQLKAEPQRVGHYIDLAHYYFVNDRMDESVEMFVRGNEVMMQPLDFDGQGYSGKAKMSAEEIELEQRLRRDDISRYPKELEKHKSFPKKDVRAFRMKLMEAMDTNSRRDLKSWPRTHRAAQEQLQNNNYDKAARIYMDFIAAAPTAVELPKAYLALMEIYCMHSDVNSLSAQFEKFYALYERKDGPSLRQCGNLLNQYWERPTRAADRTRLLKMSERSLRAGLSLPADNDNKAQAKFDLGMCLYYQERVAESVPLLRESVELTTAAGTQEDRQLRLAEALRKSGDKAGALDLYNRLKASQRANVRESANYGLIAIKQ